MDRKTVRQTIDRQVDIQINRQIDRQTGRQIDRLKKLRQRQIGGQMDSWIFRYIQIFVDKKTEVKKNRQV